MPCIDGTEPSVESMTCAPTGPIDGRRNRTFGVTGPNASGRGLLEAAAVERFGERLAIARLLAFL
ncbi:hypothetical protein JCM9743_02420 [Natrinema sp. JCM 9743]